MTHNYRIVRREIEDSKTVYEIREVALDCTTGKVTDCAPDPISLVSEHGQHDLDLTLKQILLQCTQYPVLSYEHDILGIEDKNLPTQLAMDLIR